jgi:hypothetical protein
MDLQSAQLTRHKQSTLSRVTAILFFVLACALMVGSLISPGKASPSLNGAWQFSASGTLSR